MSTTDYAEIDELLKILSKAPDAAESIAKTAGETAEFGEDLMDYDGTLEEVDHDKEEKDNVKMLKTAIEEEEVTLVEKNGPFGKALEIESNSASFDTLAAYFNARPSLLNKSLRNHKGVKTHASKKSTLKDKLPAMSGGASIIGSFEAMRNVHDLEKQTINMIGGGSKWAPALAPEATSRSTTFRKVLNTLTKRLQQNNKTLDSDDKAALTDAIDELEKKERAAYTKLAYLKKYSALVQKHKDTKDEKIKEALKSKKLEDFVGEYMHTLKRVERKSSKLWAAMGSLVVQAGPFLAVV